MKNIPMDYDSYTKIANWANTQYPYNANITWYNINFSDPALILNQLQDKDKISIIEQSQYDMVGYKPNATTYNPVTPDIPHIPLKQLQRIEQEIALLALKSFDVDLVKYETNLNNLNNTNLIIDNQKTNILLNIFAVLNTSDINVNINININYNGIKKFIDSLPLVDKSGSNNLGKYLPKAILQESTIHFGEDFIELVEINFETQFSSDLKSNTKVKGYSQINIISDPNTFVFNPDGTINDTNLNYVKNNAQYLGVLIYTQKNRPLRVTVYNLLTPGSKSNIPIDITMIGAESNKSENRTVVHLHGATTPWISDGLPLQWKTPFNEKNILESGPSKTSPPDMIQEKYYVNTHYYTNQESCRIMWYHDHTEGITRTNVYSGLASCYFLTDYIETDLISRGVLPDIDNTIPLIIQDKTFVPDNYQIMIQDPTWVKSKDFGYNWGIEGDLWYPHVYMVNQDPSNQSGANDYGRWDYGPWFWPPLVSPANLAHSIYDLNGMEIQGTPNPSSTPESFMDTVIVNGVVCPYLNVEKKAYRFKILNACNDRTINLQIYKAKSNIILNTIDSLGNLVPFCDDSGEINMLPACPDENFPENWPTDGRASGVPDPTCRGPTMYQIANESGFLPQVIEWANNPVNYEYNRRNIVVLNIDTHNVLCMASQRADIIIDFSECNDNDIFILYNDSPAPAPASDARLDYYTGVEDQSLSGGCPSILPGYVPNTRTIMQFRIQAGNAIPFDINTLKKEIPIAYAKSQPLPIIPQIGYQKNFGSKGINIAYDSLFLQDIGGRIETEQLTFKNINDSSIIESIIDKDGKISFIDILERGEHYIPETSSFYVLSDKTPTIAATANITYNEGKIINPPILNTNTVNSYRFVSVTINGKGVNEDGVNINISISTVGLINFSTIYGSIDTINIPKLTRRWRFTEIPIVEIEKPFIPSYIIQTVQAKATATINIDGSTITNIKLTEKGLGYWPFVEFFNDENNEAEIILGLDQEGKVFIKKDLINHGYGYWNGMTARVIPDPNDTGPITEALITIDTFASDLQYLNGTTTFNTGQIQTVNLISAGHYNLIPTVIITHSVKENAYGYLRIINIPNYSKPISSNSLIWTNQFIEGYHLDMIKNGNGYTSKNLKSIIHSSVLSKGLNITCNIYPKNSISNIKLTNHGSGYSQDATCHIIDKFGWYRTIQVKTKAIQELFELQYGRMNATLGVEIPKTNSSIQTTIPYGYIDPPTEILDICKNNLVPTRNDGTQIWKVVHNGVDSHPLHHHLIDFQYINKVGWDGMITTPEPEELGFRETHRHNPLEIVFLAKRILFPNLPWSLPNSYRLLDPNSLEGSTNKTKFTNIDPLGNPITVVNKYTNFGWEYAWHCHILGHEEDDFMRPIIINPHVEIPESPTKLNAIRKLTNITLSWDIYKPIKKYLYLDPKSVLNIQIERYANNSKNIDKTFNNGLPKILLVNSVSYIDTENIVKNVSYKYLLYQYNLSGRSIPSTITI
jgi:hypothetical protein